MASGVHPRVQQRGHQRGGADPQRPAHAHREGRRHQAHAEHQQRRQGAGQEGAQAWAQLWLGVDVGVGVGGWVGACACVRACVHVHACASCLDRMLITVNQLQPLHPHACIAKGVLCTRSMSLADMLLCQPLAACGLLPWLPADLWS